MKKLINGEIKTILSEDEIQKSIIKWRDEIGIKIDRRLRWLHHCANGGKIAGKNANEIKRNGAERKRLGVTKGIPDLFLPVPNKTYHGLYVELKTDTGTQSKEQKEFEKFCHEMMYFYIVARSKQEVVDIIYNYLGI